MATFKTALVVEKPAKEVFAAFMNEKNTGKWLSGYKRAELISGTHGEVGSRYKMFFDEQGKEIVMTEEITERKENNEISFSIEHDKITSEQHIYFRPIDDNITQVLVEAVVRAKGLFKIAFPVLKPIIQKRQDEDFEKFKQLVEGDGR